MPVATGERDFGHLDRDGLLGPAVRRQHHREVVTQILDVFLEHDDLDAVEAVKTAMDTRDHGDAIGRDGQLLRGFGGLRRPALQRQQAHDGLQRVHQPVIGFAAQIFLMPEQLVFFAEWTFLSARSWRRPISLPVWRCSARW